MNIIKQKNKILCILLCCVVIIGGAFAVLISGDVKNNVFTVGNVDLDLYENFEGILYNDNQITIDITNLVALNSYQKAPYVTNTGSENAYVYIMVGIPKTTAKIVGVNYEEEQLYQEAFVLDEYDTDNWINLGKYSYGDYVETNNYAYYLFAHKTEVVPDETTSSPFEKMNYKNIINIDNTITESSYMVPLFAFGVQSANITLTQDSDYISLFTNTFGG